MASMKDVNRIMAQVYLPAYERQREALNKPGFSERCGIPEVEKLARETRELEKRNADWMITKCRLILQNEEQA